MEWPPFPEWMPTVVDHNGQVIAAERDYEPGPNLVGHVSRFLGTYKWSVKTMGNHPDSPRWYGDAETLEQAEIEADQVAQSEFAQRAAREWIERPIDKPVHSGQHQSTLRIQEYRRPR